MTAQRGRRRLVLADHGILARGGTSRYIATRLHVGGTSARAVAAGCRGVVS